MKKDYKFKDDYGIECTIILGASGNLHVGVASNVAHVQKCDVSKLQFLTDEAKENIRNTAAIGTNEYGWCDYPLPEFVLVHNTMYLNPKSAEKLALKLLKYAYSGEI